MNRGVFTISLDFELFWGVRDHRTLENYGENIRNVHTIVPRLLQLFRKYDVHCTWAAVGMLFHKDKTALLSTFPERLPGYVKKAYDPYSYIRENELDAVFHFAPELIRLISETAGQEIGTHTYSHFYTLEENTTLEEFRDDIGLALKVAAENGTPVKSIVFPRNQYSVGHIAVCAEHGIKTYRGNEISPVYSPKSRKNENVFRRGIRFLDSYLNLTGHHCQPLPGRKENIVNIPASRFLRPYQPVLNIGERLKFRRIKNSMEHAAAKKLIFHLWWHPHNFGSYTKENFDFLEKVLAVYQRLNQDGKMESLSMFEIYQRCANEAG